MKGKVGCNHPGLIHVVGAAIIDGGRCLVAQRSALMKTPLKWEFPGGKIETGESPQTALKREIREELEIEVEVGSFLGRGQVLTNDRHIILDVYLCVALVGQVRLREHQSFDWFGPEAIPALDWAEADIPVLPALLRHLLGEI